MVDGQGNILSGGSNQYNAVYQVQQQAVVQQMTAGEF